MKKNLFYIATVAMSMFFAACNSEKDIIPEDTTGDAAANEEVVEDGAVVGTGYISIAINTPTESSMASRAENDDFADGLAAEYRVREAVLVLFQKAGSSENDYTFFGAYDIPVNPQLFTPINDQITSRGVSAIKITNLQNNLYALVVANPNGLLNVTSGGLSINVDGTPKIMANTNTFADFTGDYAKVLSATNNMLHNDGMSQNDLLITMCNTPYVNGTKGGSAAATGDVLTLAKLDATKLYSTEVEALSATDPTAEIYLERAVAKVTLSAADGAMAGTSDEAHKFIVKGWLLDNTNASSYLVRNVDGASNYFGYFSQGTASTNSKYRFVGYRPFSYDAGASAVSGTENMFRYYWAKDPNYDAAGTFNKVAFADGESNNVTFLPIDETRPQYCFENTFDIKHQIWSETTRVLIRAQFNSGNTFYTINKDDSKIYGSKDELDNYLAGRVIYYMGQMKAADRLDVNTTINASNWKTYFTITHTTNATTQVVTAVATLTAAGEAAIVNYNFGTGTPEQTAARQAMDEVFSDVREENRNIQHYQDGICYYQARIKHFGDDVTPWNTWESAAGLTAPASGNTSSIYPNHGDNGDAKNYLGRYGMVRNNWYALNVTAVKHIGSPVIPSITPGGDGDTPDDELDSYIAIRINIMSWAKRVQNVEF